MDKRRDSSARIRHGTWCNWRRGDDASVASPQISATRGEPTNLGPLEPVKLGASATNNQVCWYRRTSSGLWWRTSVWRGRVRCKSGVGAVGHNGRVLPPPTPSRSRTSPQPRLSILSQVRADNTEARHWDRGDRASVFPRPRPLLRTTCCKVVQLRSSAVYRSSRYRRLHTGHPCGLDEAGGRP